MNELIIELTDIGPRDFFGRENANIRSLKKYFPKLKIVARGNEIKAYGDEEVLDVFEQKVTTLLDHYAKYNRIDENVIERILLSENKADYDSPQSGDDVIVHGVSGKPIKAQTVNQRRLVAKMTQNDLVFAVGPAGTGKTYTGVALAVQALKNKQVRRIILTRPAVESGENLGFLPGDLKEKLDPYMQPLYDALRDMIPAEKLASHLESGVIQIAPLAFMRGRTLDNAFVILDEAQNTTTAQMKMFLTRMGFQSTVVITGDTSQTDLPSQTQSGLLAAQRILANIEGISFNHFTKADVVRHPLVAEIVLAYEQFG